MKYIIVMFLIAALMYYYYTAPNETENVMWFGDKGLGLTI